MTFHTKASAGTISKNRANEDGSAFWIWEIRKTTDLIEWLDST
jgi:erythromycin esterase-like protein